MSDIVNPQLSLRLLLLCLLSFQSIPAWGTTHFWFSPGASNDGTSRDKPRNYTAEFVTKYVLGPAKGQDHDVYLHFLPGEYLVAPITTRTVVPTDWRITILGEGRTPEETVLKLPPNFPKGDSDWGTAWVSVIDQGRNNEYVQRIVIENLTIDGNWSGQSQFNHAAYLRGYKNSPVYVSSRTGRLRNLIVRNHGAHGLMPQRPTDSGAGVETFPIHVFTRDEGQQPEDGDPVPWLIENCEVHGFNALYAGYCTTLMGNVEMDPAKASGSEDPNRRMIWFRANQVRGNADGRGLIGMGTAGHGPHRSGRVVWSDGVVLNGVGFNTDTGVIRWLDITNLLMLDVASIGYLGTPQVGQPYQQNYRISGNAVRLGGFVDDRNYKDYRVARNAAGKMAAETDPKLVLGRPVPSASSGLMVGGLAHDIQLTDNWFSTRPRNQYQRSSTRSSSDPQFRLVYRFADKHTELPDFPAIKRGTATEVDFSGNMLSSVPFDFERMQSVGGARVRQLTDGSSPLLERRSVRIGTNRFTPSGTVERVAMIFRDSPLQTGKAGSLVKDRRLLGAIEIVCGTPAAAASGGKFIVPVRLAIQPTPGSGIPGTKPLASQRVFLEVLAGSLHPQKLSAVTDAEGLATFSYDVPAGANGMDFFRVWKDSDQGSSENWEEYQDAWSTDNYAHGTTVSVQVDNEVADARNSNPGGVRLVRTGPVDRPLTVQIGFADGPWAAEEGKDFKVTASARKRSRLSKAKDNEPSDSTFEFARGQREVELQIEALPKTARNSRLVTLQVQKGDGYAAGYPASGDVVIYLPQK